LTTERALLVAILLGLALVVLLVLLLIRVVAELVELVQFVVHGAPPPPARKRLQLDAENADRRSMSTRTRLVIAILVTAGLALVTAAAARSAVPAPPHAVTIIHGYCPDGLGVACTYPDGRIYLGPGTGLSELRHELGHAFDDQALTPALRAQFARIFGRTDAAAWRDNVGNDGNLAEWFAEGYRVCSMFPRYRGLSSVDGLSYGYEPTRGQQAHVCALIRYAGARARAH
jgi:Spy/CpxP family protein refolding chaperone